MQRLLGVPSSKRIINFHTAPYSLVQDGAVLTREQAPLLRAVSGAEVHGETIDFQLTDGRTITALVFAAPIRDENDTIVGAIANFLDVSELRLAERRSAERLRLLANAGQHLSEALNVDAIFRALSRDLVPAVAPYIQMLVLDEDGWPIDVRMAHADRQKDALISQLRTQFGVSPQFFDTSLRVAKTNAPEVISDLHVLLERHDLSGPYRSFMMQLIEQVGIQSSVIVPMRNHGNTAGVLVLSAEQKAAFNHDDVMTIAEIARRAATAIQNAALFAHHEQVSRALQEALLPPSLPKVGGITFDTIYAPGDDRALIGGDWYDAFTLPDGRIAVTIGDVTGRGATAAAMMGKVRQTISGLSFYESDPVKLLDVAERALMRRHPDSLVTAIVGILDPATGEFVYATAGHPPPFVRRADGGVFTLPCHGLPLGLRTEEHDRSSVTFRLLPGDTLLLYTDGLTEVNQDPIEGEFQTKHALSMLPPPRRDAATYIRETLLPNGSRDDVAMLSLHFEGSSVPPTVTLREPTALEIKFNSRDARMARDLRVFITEYLRAYGDPHADYNAVELVLGELLGNAVRHASGPIEMHLTWNGEFPELAMLDFGPPYDPALAVPEDPWEEGGRGLYIVGLLTRAFHVARLFGGVNETRAELDVPRRKAA